MKQFANLRRARVACLALSLTGATFALVLGASAVLAGIGQNTQQDTKQQDVTDSAQEEKKPARPNFAGGEARVVEAFNNPDEWIQHDLWVETEFDSDEDGKLDRMHVDVTRPKQTDTEGLKVAVIYATSPYYCGTSTTNKRYFWDPKQELGEDPPERTNPPEIRARTNRPIISRSEINSWVPRGFAVVHSSSPGTGLSEGCPTVGGDNESLAPKAVIDWLNGRVKGYTEPDGDEEVKATWCTGKVGMTGTSYNGTLPLAAATTGVDGLEAIIPIAPNTSYYHYYRTNGLIRHPGGYMGEDIDVLYDYINSGDKEGRAGCNELIREGELVAGFDRVNGDYNEFWAGRDYLNELEPLKAATLIAHGFNDWNVVPEHTVRIYEALKKKGVPVQCFFHQGGHGGAPPFSMMNRWFTRYLYDVQNGVEEDERAWVVREDASRNSPTAYADYPNPEAKLITLHLGPGGKKAGTLTVDAVERDDDESRTETLIDDVTFDGEALAKKEESEHRLIYVTPELTKDLHISGAPRITIKLASSKPAANLSIWLVSLPWEQREQPKDENKEGEQRRRRRNRTPLTDNLITRGWADPQNYRSLTESEPLEPGKFYELTFDLQPDDQIIRAGQQIGLMIMSSDRDFTLWPEPGTELTIDLDGTKLELPVVGGAKAFTAATSN
ncbi:MAG: Xaa-Pro dipeptidyl-peptidase [Pirellulales bacterium]|nr:Xaa-Pro dipeptidyl-peptidase [Pirellulales bacterium]